MLQRQIGAQHQEGFALVQVSHRGQLALPCLTEGVEQRYHVARTVMVDVVGAQHGARELLQIEILFVGGVVGADHAERAAVGQILIELLRDRGERFAPGDFFQFAVAAQQGSLQTVGMIVEIEGVAPGNPSVLGGCDAGAVLNCPLPVFRA